MTKYPNRARKPRRTRKTPKAPKQGFDIRVIPDNPQLPTVGDLMGSTPEVTRIRRVIKFPANWWEHMKRDLFPLWVRVRWPVQMAEHVWWEMVPARGGSADLPTVEQQGWDDHSNGLECNQPGELLSDEWLDYSRGWDRSVDGRPRPE